MAFVLDASVVLAWLLPDEQSATAQDIVARLATQRAQAPALLHYEVGNALSQAVRRGRIGPALRSEMLETFFALPIATEPPDERAIAIATELASQHPITVYDACYIELSLRRALPLATLDRALAAAARAVGVETLPAICAARPGSREPDRKEPSGGRTDGTIREAPADAGTPPSGCRTDRTDRRPD